MFRVRSIPPLVALSLTACIAPHESIEAETDAGEDGATDDAEANDAGEGEDAGKIDAACDTPTLYYRDQDGDGKGDPKVSEPGCSPPEGFVDTPDDPQPLCALDDGDDCTKDDLRCTPEGQPHQRQRCVADDVGCTRWQTAAPCEEDAPHCDTTDDATCKACTGAQDCTGFDSAGVCDTEVGACVQCTHQDKEACVVDGTQHVCDPTTATCDLEREVQSKSLCQTCISNDECQTDQACADVDAGAGETVCLQIATGDNGESCGRPYPIGKDAATADGDTTRVCTFNVATTCQAHDDYLDKDCAPGGSPDDSLCGAEGLNDGYCVPFGGGFRCTVRCASVDDCPTIDGLDNACEEAEGSLRLCTLSSSD